MRSILYSLCCPFKSRSLAAHNANCNSKRSDQPLEKMWCPGRRESIKASLYPERAKQPLPCFTESPGLSRCAWLHQDACPSDLVARLGPTHRPSFV